MGFPPGVLSGVAPDRPYLHACNNVHTCKICGRPTSYAAAHQILEAAHDLIATEGVEALSMRTLADNAQVSVPTIYALVGGRDDVIAALMTEGVHRFDDGLAGLDSRGLFRVTDVIDLLTRIVDHERELVRGLLASGVLASKGPEQFVLLHRVRQELERAFAEAVVGGELAGGPTPAWRPPSWYGSASAPSSTGWSSGVTPTTSGPICSVPGPS